MDATLLLSPDALRQRANPSVAAGEEIERRFVTLDRAELRDSGTGLQFHGHAAVFNQIVDFGFFREQVASGAFAKTIQEADVRFLYNHNPDTVMARTKPGNRSQASLRLAEDSVGLAVEADLDQNDADVQRLVPKLRSGNVDQMSFAFRVIREEWDDSDARSPLRTIREVKLYDVSPVTFPAYEGTDAQLRAALASFQRGGLLVPFELRGPIASHSTGTTDTPFDSGAMKARLPNTKAALRSAFAWVDSAADPEAKGSYKFIHHMVSEAGSVGAANTRACSSGIGVLNGGRGGANIPDGDRQGVYNHLARHLRDAGVTPPELDSEPTDDLDWALDVLLAHAGGRAVNTEQAARAQRAVAELRALLDAPEDAPSLAHPDLHPFDADRALRSLAVRRRRLRIA